MTDEVLAWLKGLMPSYRSHLRKVNPLSYEAWLEVKSHRWAVFVNPDNPKQDGRLSYFVGTDRRKYEQTLKGLVEMTERGMRAVIAEFEKRLALAVLDKMGQVRSSGGT